MIGGTIRRIALLCLVNAILVAGSSRIYAKEQTRNRRDASCPSCSRDRPDALANWSSPPRESREASSSSWASSINQPVDSVQSSSVQSSSVQSSPMLSSPWLSSPLQPQSWQSSPVQSSSVQYSGLQPPVPQFQQPGSSYSLNPLNPYRGAIGGGGGPGVIRPWSTSRRENPFSFGTRNLNPDLAPAPASPLYSLNPPVSPVAPFQPYSPVIRTSDRVPYGRPDIFGLSRSQSSQLSQGNLDYAPIQTGSVFDNPKSKLSVVYRADKYNDDSNEDDNVPLYPSDYPRRLVVGGQDNVYPSGYPRIWRGQGGLVNGGLQDNAPSFPVDYLRRVATGESQNARKVAAVQLSRAETIVNPQRELRVLNGAGNIISPFRDTRMADTVTKPEEDLQDAVVGAALRQSQTDRVQDARMTDRIMQGDQSRTDRIAQPQKHQPRDSRMADRYMQPEIDQTQDTRALQSLAQSLKDQPRESRMAGRFVQPQDQARDTRMAEQFSQPPEDNPRLSSIMQVPETRSRNLPSEMEIFKVIQQIGNMFANRSSQEDSQKEQERGQQGDQLAKKTNENDQVQESKVSPGPGEVKEKRDVADGERVPVMQNDMVELGSLEGIVPETTFKILTMSPIETMD